MATESALEPKIEGMSYVAGPGCACVTTPWA